GEAVIAFEDVFVPTERVFMDGETDFTGALVYRFAAHHRAKVESMHGAGSPQAQRVMIFREGQLDKKIRLAKALLGIPVKGK
ncbi:MAG: 4-hydroxybutyryl-CoA dehydratase / vinylacetyl-CoA-Delta-isomerase, partial [Thermodesulfobacteriota bacterium]|nr:4-hydroxybutyryl-CoA dehydratase / vinylacetyl-CoA-Delta-isomerase [Thermodesulfobacteriota bacterium]